MDGRTTRVVRQLEWGKSVEGSGHLDTTQLGARPCLLACWLFWGNSVLRAALKVEVVCWCFDREAFHPVTDWGHVRGVAGATVTTARLTHSRKWRS